MLRPTASSYRPDAPERGLRVAAIALVILAAISGLGLSTASAPPGPSAPLAPAVQRTLALPTAAGSTHPAVTTLWDWDPQPFVVPPTFPLGAVAGQGASMVTSDPFGTVLVFGGESPGGLTNLTVLANETSGNWEVLQGLPASPSARTNASVALTGDGRWAVLFGGEVSLASGAVTNDTWLFSFVTDTWTNVTGRHAPPARESAAFAIDTVAGQGLLEGGWSPTTSVSGGGASVIWNDTWSLNLTTWNWSALADPTAPNPMYGSAMAFDPLNSSFYLFGGCPGLGICSSALYQYRLGGNWSIVRALGDLPPARGAASLVWASTWDVVMMFGGFQFAFNSFYGLNDTYIYSPADRTWNLVAGVGPPGRFDAPAAFLANNNCPGMLVAGGSYALSSPPPDGWFLDENPDLGSGCNIWGGDQVGGSSGPGPGPCPLVVNVTVRALDVATLAPIPGASINIVGKCGVVRDTTGVNGTVTLSLPNENVTLSALAAVYHPSSLKFNTTLPPSPNVTIGLTHLPILVVHTFGESYPATVSPLPGVLVSWFGGTIGVTDANGTVVDPGFIGPQGVTPFTASRPYYENATNSTNIPFTGTVELNLTLLQDGPFAVQVWEAPDRTPIANATGVIEPVGAYTYGGTVVFRTGANGWFNLSLPQANYTVYVTAPGFTANRTSGSVFHPWMVTTVISLSLVLQVGPSIDVRLLNAYTHHPIPAGVVRVGDRPASTTSLNGYANFTNVLPTGTYNVTGSATGYRENYSIIVVTYLRHWINVTLNLTPAGGCPTGCSGVTNGTLGDFRLLPGPGTTLELFVFAPLALVIATAVYIAYLRRPETEGAVT